MTCYEKFPINENIEKKLDYFYQTNQIPNIIFHGSSGTGKKTIVFDFLYKIYNNDKQKIKTNIMIVNCSHGKGIKFIREELKFFAKTNIQTNSGVMFKSIV
jgi:replication factor C subunit 3/5